MAILHRRRQHFAALTLSRLAPMLLLTAWQGAATAASPQHESNRPAREQLLKKFAEYEQAYQPYYLTVVSTIRFAEPLTPAQRSHPWGDGRKHQTLLEYGQRGPRWLRRETRMVDDVVGAQYEWYCDGRQAVSIAESGPGEPPRVNVFHDKSELIRLPYIPPLLGVFPLSIYSDGDLVSKIAAEDASAVELAWQGNDGLLTVSYGPKERPLRWVIRLSREHGWHPERMQYFSPTDAAEPQQDWEVTKFVQQGKQWRIAAGTIHRLDLPARKLDHFEDFEVVDANYGDDVHDGPFAYQIPVKALVEDHPAHRPEDVAKMSQIVNPEGQPVAFATVSIRLPNQNRAAPLTITANSQGRFDYPADLPMTGYFDVTFAAPDPTPENRKVNGDAIVFVNGARVRNLAEYLPETRTGNQDAYLLKNGVRVPDRIVLSRPATIFGRVIGADGLPIAGGSLMVTELGYRWTNGYSVRIDTDGHFQLVGLRPGHIILHYQSAGAAPGQRGAARVQAGELGIVQHDVASGDAVEGLDIDLRKSRCVIEGALVDHAGKGVAGGTIRLGIAEGNTGGLATFRSATSDEHGSFRFDKLPPERFQLLLSGASGSNTPTTVDTTLDRPARVRLANYCTGSPPPADRDWQPAWGRPNALGLEAAIEFEPRKSIVPCRGKNNYGTRAGPQCNKIASLFRERIW